MDNLVPRRTKREKVADNRIRADIVRSGFASLPASFKVIVDCSFQDIMDFSEKASLAVQLQECYSHLRRFGEGRSQLLFGSVSADLLDCLNDKGGSNWAVHIHSSPVEDVSSALDTKLIFLSPDATEELSADEVYDTRNMFVIGGIVDKVVSRNETAHKALRLGMDARRLPMDESMKARVLNIDTVYMFLVRCYNSPNMMRSDMIQLLSSIIPDRKKDKSHFEEIVKVPMVKPVTVAPDEEIGTKLETYNVIQLFR